MCTRKITDLWISLSLLLSIILLSFSGIDYTPPMTPVSQLEGCIFSLTVGEGNEMLPVYLHDIDNSLRVEDFIRFEDIYVPQG